MEQSVYGGQPGYGTTQTQNFTEVLASTALQAKMVGGVLLAQGFGVVAKGTVLGKITASGKFAPYASTTLSAAAASGATSITVNYAGGFVVGDTVVVGAEAAIAITAINGNVITLASGLTAAQAIGDTVATNDGRQNAVCILDNDQDTTTSDVGASAWVAGYFNSSALAGYNSNAKTGLQSNGLFIFA